MNYMIRPGVDHLTEDYIVGLITETFGFKNRDWVTSKSHSPKDTIPRFLLICCLREFLRYSLKDAAAVCNRDHAMAVYSVNVINGTYLTDKLWGEKVKKVYYECKNLRDERLLYRKSV